MAPRDLPALGSKTNVENRIKGVKPWDGEYELDEDRAFNAREWRWIKKVSGYVPLTLGEGFADATRTCSWRSPSSRCAGKGRLTGTTGLRVPRNSRRHRSTSRRSRWSVTRQSRRCPFGIDERARRTIATKLAEEQDRFWGEFEERFGDIGRDPAAYYSYEVGHILGVPPDQVGELTPGDLLGALVLFDHKYRAGGD